MAAGCSAHTVRDANMTPTNIIMEITNECKNPPWCVVRHVRRSLGWINKADLEGLSLIRLVDDLPKPTAASSEEIKEAFAEGFHIYALYNRRRNKNPAYITLNVRDIYKGVPRIYWLTTVPTVLIANTLAHEVGHHVMAKRGYIIQPGKTAKLPEHEEIFAERYAFGVLERMRARWYYRAAHWAIKDLSRTHYIWAMISWRSKNYVKAARHWYIASELDPNNNDADYWYKRARQMLKT